MMTLLELQNVLGERVAATLKSKEMSPEDRYVEIEQSNLVVNIAKQMINNGDLILRTEKLLAMTNNLKQSYAYKLINGTDGSAEIERAS